jgi:predicted alpha/beta hydrolase family esterase
MLVLIAGAFLIAPPVVAAQWNGNPYFTTFAPANHVHPR